jgi:hypothetical protein
MGQNVSEAFTRLYFLVMACNAQISAGDLNQCVEFPPQEVCAFFVLSLWGECMWSLVLAKVSFLEF